MDNGRKAPTPFKAPQPQLFAIIIEGILGGKLEWSLVAAGALIAVVLELMAISALPVAVGMYLGLGTATPISFSAADGASTLNKVKCALRFLRIR